MSSLDPVALRAALERARRAADPRRVAACALALAESEPDDAPALLAEAAARADEAGWPAAALEAHLALARRQGAQGDPAGAFEHLERALAVPPASWPSALARGEAQAAWGELALRLDRAEEAVAALADALVLLPAARHPRLLLTQAHALLALNRGGDAVAALRRALSDLPDDTRRAAVELIAAHDIAHGAVEAGVAALDRLLSERLSDEVALRLWVRRALALDDAAAWGEVLTRASADAAHRPLRLHATVRRAACLEAEPGGRGQEEAARLYLDAAEIDSDEVRKNLLIKRSAFLRARGGALDAAEGLYRRLGDAAGLAWCARSRLRGAVVAEEAAEIAALAREIEPFAPTLLERAWAAWASAARGEPATRQLDAALADPALEADSPLAAALRLVRASLGEG